MSTIGNCVNRGPSGGDKPRRDIEAIVRRSDFLTARHWRRSRMVRPRAPFSDWNNLADRPISQISKQISGLSYGSARLLTSAGALRVHQGSDPIADAGKTAVPARSGESFTRFRRRVLTLGVG